MNELDVDFLSDKIWIGVVARNSQPRKWAKLQVERWAPGFE